MEYKETAGASQGCDETRMDLDNFMDVVTTYKCKFCDFSCTAAPKMGLHVKAVHLKSANNREKNGIPSNISFKQPAQETIPNSNSTASIIIDAGMPTRTVSRTEDFTALVNEGAVDNDPLEHLVSMFQTATTQTSVVSDDVSEEGNKQYATQSQQKVIVIQGHIAESLNVQVDEESENSVSMEENELKQDSNSPTMVDVNSADTVSVAVGRGEASYEHYTVTTADSLQEGQSGHVTKELFLCGQCSVGFNSIHDCKAHMLAEHGQTLAEQADESWSMKVDAATQVEPKKKPGRKRKSEILQEPKDESPEMSDSDEDWTEKLEIDTYNGRSKRKRRPPKALKQDYYLGKNKTKTRQRVEGYIIKCNTNGCNAKFRNEESLHLHLECHVEDSTAEVFRCLSCEEKFFAWKACRAHLWKRHGMDTDLLTCDVCRVFKTDTMSKLLIHKEIHSDERPYTCDQCGKGFKQFAQMKNHQMSHSVPSMDDPDKWYTSKDCEICQRTFANAKCLKKHIEAVHSKMKPYVCNFCNHACARKAMLELHLRVHTQEKPFKCDVCTFTTGDHNSLRRHKMRHTGQKPYKCPHCPYACIQAISLKVHMKNKHPGMEGVYNCELCLFRTINKLHYLNHTKDHENGLIDPLDTSELSQVKAQLKSRKPRALRNEIRAEVQKVGETTEVQMRVQTNEEGQSVISAEDLAKLSSYEGLVPGDITAAQLIYSALNAISQSSQQNGCHDGDTANPLPNVQTSVSSSSIKDGLTTHTITFHIPHGLGSLQDVAMETGSHHMLLHPMEVVAIPQEQHSEIQTVQSLKNEVGEAAEAITCITSFENIIAQNDGTIVIHQSEN
ncbi:hypothetical protein ACJMK2_010832 [Sinanodonta woodiana]|uniref:C2H2-type domain-containing protein n=1 Tax=Sinanodonta woodiana TaxID=1069815 RepID=A0ABD3VGP1_SINWO